MVGVGAGAGAAVVGGGAGVVVFVGVAAGIVLGGLLVPDDVDDDEPFDALDDEPLDVEELLFGVFGLAVTVLCTMTTTGFGCVVDARSVGALVACGEAAGPDLVARSVADGSIGACVVVDGAPVGSAAAAALSSPVERASIPMTAVSASTALAETPTVRTRALRAG